MKLLRGSEKGDAFKSLRMFQKLRIFANNIVLKFFSHLCLFIDLYSIDSQLKRIKNNKNNNLKESINLNSFTHKIKPLIFMTTFKFEAGSSNHYDLLLV